jgi:hypothetical protein
MALPQELAVEHGNARFCLKEVFDQQTQVLVDSPHQAAARLD